MDKELMLDVSQAHELKLAFRRAGYTKADIKKLSEGDLLTRLLLVVRDDAEIKSVTRVIDCDTEPFVPYDGWEVEEHRKGGQFTWNPEAVKFHLSPNQMGEKYIEGNQLRKELAREPMLNANVLDYLMRYPHLIPESWKVDERGSTRYTYFWGTIYRNSHGYSCVRNLFFGGHWRCHYDCLEGNWRHHDSGARRTS